MTSCLRTRALLPSGLILALLFLAGCAGAPDPRPIAEDPVCRYHRDLGCVKVRVSDTTPRADYLGKTYYFCREGCRDVFLKDPVRYLPGAGGSGGE